MRVFVGLMTVFPLQMSIAAVRAARVLLFVPKRNDKIYYWAQGHYDQMLSNPDSESSKPWEDLGANCPSHMVCRVLFCDKLDWDRIDLRRYLLTLVCNATGYKFKCVYRPFLADLAPYLTDFAYTTEALTKWKAGDRVEVFFSDVEDWFTGRIVKLESPASEKWPNSPWNSVHVRWDSEPDGEITACCPWECYEIARKKPVAKRKVGSKMTAAAAVATTTQRGQSPLMSAQPADRSRPSRSKSPVYNSNNNSNNNNMTIARNDSFDAVSRALPLPRTDSLGVIYHAAKLPYAGSPAPSGSAGPPSTTLDDFFHPPSDGHSPFTSASSSPEAAVLPDAGLNLPTTKRGNKAGGKKRRLPYFGEAQNQSGANYGRLPGPLVEDASMRQICAVKEEDENEKEKESKQKETPTAPLVSYTVQQNVAVSVTLPLAQLVPWSALHAGTGAPAARGRRQKAKDLPPVDSIPWSHTTWSLLQGYGLSDSLMHWRHARQTVSMRAITFIWGAKTAAKDVVSLLVSCAEEVPGSFSEFQSRAAQLRLLSAQTVLGEVEERHVWETQGSLCRVSGKDHHAEDADVAAFIPGSMREVLDSHQWCPLLPGWLQTHISPPYGVVSCVIPAGSRLRFQMEGEPLLYEL